MKRKRNGRYQPSITSVAIADRDDVVLQRRYEKVCGGKIACVAFVKRCWRKEGG